MRTNRIRVWTLASATLLLWSCTAVFADSIEAQAVRYLPSGATFARVPHLGSDGGTTVDPVVASGSATRWGGRDLAFVYEAAGKLALRVVTTSAGQPKEFEARLPGSFVSGSDSFPNGLLLKDVTGAGVQQMLVVTSEGASLGSFLSVFSVGSHDLDNLVRGGTIAGYGFDLDCAAGRPCRVLAGGKWTDAAGAWVQVYEWLGTAFVETDKDADRYFSARLVKLAAAASEQAALPVPARVHMAELAATLYQNRHEYDQAIELCQAVLSRLENPASSAERPGVVVPGTGRQPPLRSDISLGEADLHDLLGNAFGSAGRAADAQAEYRLAQDLRNSEANH